MSKLFVVASGVILWLGGCGVAENPDAPSEPVSAVQQAVDPNDNGSVCLGGYPFYGSNNLVTNPPQDYYGCRCLTADQKIGVLADRRDCPASDPPAQVLHCLTTNIPYQAQCGSDLITYPMNRVSNVENTLLDCPCMLSTTGRIGKLTSKCQAQPTTCGWLYCM